MKITMRHQWNVDRKEAVALQKKLSRQLHFPKLVKALHIVAGADISYSKNDPRIFGAVVLLKVPEMEVLDVLTDVDCAPFPYITGLLGFRELPILCKIFSRVKKIPDVVICDGQGIAHPRGLGLASHLGLFLNVPTVGCAKTRLIGTYEEVEKKQWSQSELSYKNKIVGAVVRTRENVKPVFISPGNGIDLSSAIEVIKQCTTHYRLPEPIRQAHFFVNRIRKSCQNEDKKAIATRTTNRDIV